MRKTFFLLMAAVLAWESRADAPASAPEAIAALRKVCANAGLFELRKAGEVNFQFNVEMPGRQVHRLWKWKPEGDSVFLNGKYQGEKRPGEFVNDIYWLAFPLMAYDSRDQAEITLLADTLSPIAKKPCARITVHYVADKGFTPKDAYHLYVDANAKILEWAYLKGGEEPPKLVTSWEDYREFNGVTLSLSHRGAGDFHLYFDKVSISP